MPCFGSTGQLSGSGSNAAIINFQWNTSNGNIASGGNTATPTITLPGTYILVVSNPVNGCTDSDDVIITPEEPEVELTVVQPACEGDKGTIAVTELVGAQPPVLYSIDGGQTFSGQNVFTGLLPGDYTVQIVDATGCGTSRQATIIPPAVFVIDLATEAQISFGESYQINTIVSLPMSDIASIQWTPSTGLSCDTCLSPLAMPLTSTRYNLTVISEVGCEERAPILLRVDREIDIYIPNIFSPDGDGDNDVFMIFANTDQVRIIKEFQVYSRWGEQVLYLKDFLPNDPQFGWDGMHRGDPLNPAVFVWYVVVELIDGREILLEGDVTLTR
jgi:gliding motility-associated-like protein